jgi:hypothetical protein
MCFLTYSEASLIISRLVNRLAAASMAVSDADLTVSELVFDGVGGVCLSGIRVLSLQTSIKTSFKPKCYFGNSFQFTPGSASVNFVNPDPGYIKKAFKGIIKNSQKALISGFKVSFMHPRMLFG